MVWRGLPLLIFGSGGISKEVYCIIKEINNASNNKIFDFIGFIGLNKMEVGSEVIDGYKIVSSDEEIVQFISNYKIIGMSVPIGNPKIKKLLYEKVKDINNVVFPNVIHPSIYFNKENITIGNGNIIAAGVNLTCNIKIGNFNLINLNSTIGHDTQIGNFNVINPLVALSGNVFLKDSCLIGTGAQVLQGLDIENYSTVGAGAVVVKNVEPNTTVIGIPAKSLK